VFYIAIALVGGLRVPSWEILLGLPVVLMSMVTWGTFVGMMASRFRDLRFMMPYLSQLIFFLTPIFWTIGTNAKGWRSAIVADYNPFYGLVEVIRAPLLGQAPSAQCWMLAIIAMVTGIIAWLLMFSAFRRRIPFWV
jgi:ABC-type polysaccharide/polyol phosphate export permease